MNNLHKLSLISFIGGFIFFSIGAVTGEVEVGFFLIFPFLIGSGIFSTFGIILVFISILLFIFGFAFGRKYNFNEQFERTGKIKEKKTMRGGGVVLIGPIPIVFGSNWKITIIMMIIAVLIILFYFLFFRFLN